VPLIYDVHGEPVEIAPGRGDLRYSSVPFSTAGSGRSVKLVDGKPVSFARIFAEQIWVGAAVMRLLGSSIRVPLKVYRRTGDDSRERLRPNEHPLARAIVDPWERGSAADLTMSMLGPMLVHGNDLTGIEQGARDVIRFEPFDWRSVWPIKAFEKRIAGWDVYEDGQKRTVPADTTIHLAWWSPLGPLGVSPLQQLGVTLSIEDAAQRYQRSLFKRGARPPSAITADKEFLALDRTERDALIKGLREDVDDIYGGPDNAGKPAVLPPGLDWKQVGHTAVEAALIDQRKVAREEVCAIYQIPPPILGVLDRATFNNITTLREVYYTDGLGPPLVLIEHAINAQLVRALLREDDIYVEFDFAAVLRGDRLKEIQALREAIQIMLMTPNEGRTVINLPKSDAPGADELWAPRNNLKPLNEAVSDDLGERSLAAQRLAQASKNGLISDEEGRHMIGLDGPGPDDEDDEPAETEPEPTPAEA